MTSDTSHSNEEALEKGAPYLISKEKLLCTLAEIGVGIGFDENAPIIKIAEYISQCVKHFHLSPKEGKGILLEILKTSSERHSRSEREPR